MLTEYIRAAMRCARYWRMMDRRTAVSLDLLAGSGMGSLPLQSPPGTQRLELARVPSEKVC